MPLSLIQPSFLISKTRSYVKIFIGSRLFLTAMAIHLSLRVAPLDLQQGGNSRIPYVHVLAAWMNSFFPFFRYAAPRARRKLSDVPFVYNNLNRTSEEVQSTGKNFFRLVVVYLTTGHPERQHYTREIRAPPREAPYVIFSLSLPLSGWWMKVPFQGRTTYYDTFYFVERKRGSKCPINKFPFSLSKPFIFFHPNPILNIFLDSLRAFKSSRFIKRK
ncbi:hypothetical protein Ccrd_026060, partial [Cynara cardunculus var. scolymus]